MSEFYVLKSNGNSDEIFLNRIKPYEEMYMAVNNSDYIEMSHKDYEDLEQKFCDFFKILTEREANIATLYYGFLGKKYSIREIATIMRTTPERINELKNRVIYRAKKDVNLDISDYQILQSCYMRKKELLSWTIAGFLLVIYIQLYDKKEPKHYLKRILEKKISNSI